ncbi:hypothetical protein HHK36_003382 [Tetracentron sinense]|uniref:Uncharacterized protein n=1 Tax=Tetracentron sinense TaxID=13715 RepID=A0A834ZST5_TETSI|nr:hypothetical protein HHK36_003382 [Tetracentron sinense]
MDVFHQSKQGIFMFFSQSSTLMYADLALHVKHQFLPIHLWVFDVVSILAGLFFCFIGLFGNKGEDTLLEEPLLDSSTEALVSLGCNRLGLGHIAALVAMIYKKGLTLSSQSRQGHSIGEIINFMSVDAERIDDFSWFMHDLWLAPLQVALALLILYKNLGLASIATFVATLIVMLANVPLGKLQEKFQGKLMESKDGRMKATSEILRNMRILKLQGWEMKFLSKIIELRKNEAGWLRKYVYTSANTTSVLWTTPTFVSVVTFGPTKVPLTGLPHSSVSMTLQPDVLERLPMGSSELAVAVCGTVGSGKSSLLSCILGEMPKVSGTLKLCGTKAYVAQSPWIQSGFEECLLGLLGSKTVIYVTHQVEFLPSADLILVMKDGRITQAGKYNDILSSGTDFMELVGAHNKALSDLDSVEAGPPPSENLINIEEDGDVGMAKEAMCKEEEKRDDQNGQMNEVVEPKGQLVQEEEREKGRVGFPVYWKYITAAYRGTLVPFILLAQILFQLLQIGSNYWMAWATPVSKDARPAVEGSTLIFVYVALALGSAVCVLVRAMLLVMAGYKTATLLFNKMHLCIFRAAMSFFDSTPSGRILNRASTDQSAVDMNIPLQVGQFAFTIIQLLGIIAVMSQVAWQVFIIFIPVIATCVWYQQYYIPSARELSRLVGVCKAPVIQHFAESISGSTTIRSFDQESRFWDVNMKLIDGYSRPKFHTAGAMEWLCFRLAMLSSITFAFSLIFLISIPDGVIDPGIAGLAVTYGLNLNTLQARVIRTLCNLENRIISVERILQYMSIPSEPPLVVEENKPRHDWPSHGEVDIQDLQVRYAPHMPFVLRGLTCTFSGGMKTGIVGRTGSGKSTLIQTLFRIVEPTVGQILIDGINISTIGLHDLRSRLSIIPQDPTMFEGNVRSNLDPLEEYTDEQIWEALDRCQLGEEVRKKEGKLDATVIENGENWSMGQRQLVCLGRVLLKKSKVLVLDEATASVDTATDNLIQQTLKQHFADCTVVTIAHRITSVLDSDMVILLDHGLVQCFHDELSALLQLKTGFSASDPLLPSWKLATNCCSWEGVSCHNATSHVIGLDLSSYRLSGYLNSSSLRRLRFLRTLNLADNDFGPSPIPSSLDGVVNLTHLNLSHSGFSGQVPLEISRLTKLVSLDISTYDSSLKLENPNLRILIQNLSSLRELILDGVNISAHGRDWCNAVSSALPNLRVLSLSRCYLSGALHDSLLQLRFLSELRLNENNLSSVVPDFLANFSSLTSLELGSCQLHGELPKKIMLLPTLQRLNLRDNSLLTGSLPEFRENSALKVLLLAFTTFFGELPDSIGNLKFLTELDLSSCNFYGPIPSSLANLTQLVLLDLSSNRFDNWMPLLPPSKRITTETLSTAQISSTYHDQLLPNLRYLYLLNNSLSATVHSSLFVLPSLKRLLLNQNQLTGILNEFENASSSLLKTVDLSNNKLEGPIPESLFRLVRISDLRMFSNNFSGTVDSGMFQNLKNLTILDLSYNNLLSISNSSAKNSTLPPLEKLILCSCNINEIPDFLRNQESLVELDLSDNKIHGRVPNWVWKQSLSYLNLSHNFLNGLEQPFSDLSLTSLTFLDLHSNMFKGSFPILPPYINYLSISDNKLTGEIPLSICNASSLAILDLSQNHMSGLIPQCFGGMGNTLIVLNLRGNNFHGSMPQNFTEGCSLQTLDFYGNQLKGKVSRFLANCKRLEVLDLGNNQINDTFPSWLENLPKLQVLILQSNKFYGLIGSPRIRNNSFPMLHILDLSSNAFTGDLPSEYFKSWNAMMINENKPKLDYLGGYYYKDRMTITNKGLEMDGIKILTIFTVLDLSNNQFEGEIPEVIGDLKLVQVLNLSQNSLRGRIPSSLQHLTLLESFDLSQNKLSGEIPWQLTSLTFLSVLNLSHNLLVGRIPEGRQFLTFTNASYEGNSGLCGFPLSRTCGDAEASPPYSWTSQEGDSTSEFDWKFFMFIGYGCGVVMGVLIGYVLLWRNQCCSARFERFSRGKGAKKSLHRRRRRHLKMAEKKAKFCINDNGDVLVEILKRLDDRSLGVAACVCRLWCSITRQDSVWENLCFRHVYPPPSDIRPVVVAMGGYRRLYMVCLRPVLSRLSRLSLGFGAESDDADRVKRVCTRDQMGNASPTPPLRVELAKS